MSASTRHLVLVLGDQLNRDAAVFDDFDPDQDVVVMAEAAWEASEVTWSHKARIALFLSAMRHFRDELRDRGLTVEYHALESDGGGPEKLSDAFRDAIRAHQPERVRVTHPGEWRVLDGLRRLAQTEGADLEVCEDRHFLCTPEEFNDHAEGRKQLRMEFFYRELRKRHHVLLDENGKPEGGSWNYDADNRGAFGKKGPPSIPAPPTYSVDDSTQEVLDLVEARFGDHPGKLDGFNWPVTRRQALHGLRSFVSDRLPRFGEFQDAMWTKEPFLWHSLISASLNLKLLNPREVIEAVEVAWRERDDIPLAAAEGFIRQILGWREYVRGVYWSSMPGYLQRNTLRTDGALPDWYWTGDTDMACLRESLRQTLDHGYSHHIQRLMVTGTWALLAGVHPVEVHKWYLGVYVDAVEWVELPNTLGMSQYADDGVMASKPYIASGKYIQRMSNYCEGCRYRPDKRTGDDACPFTTLYWDFLRRHEDTLTKLPRMRMQLRNLDRLDQTERAAIAKQAATWRAESTPIHKELPDV